MPSFEFLGPYRIGEAIGRGGMGTVFSAVHEKTGERVAVKLIAQHVSDEPRFRRRFEKEFRTLERLRHPGIVRIIGVGEEEGQLFYSMELVEGESLQARIRREKRLDWRPTLDIAIQICSALKHAHDIGVWHRDLKPANLMLTGSDQIKLVDFGIVKVFGDSEQTLPGAVLGTADYMAPEQATGGPITPRTDLYALGNVMYAMLTGRPPFTGKKLTEVIESLKRDRPVPLDLVNPDLPEALVELVHNLLEKEPGDRPPTALSVMKRLKAMRAGLQRQRTVLSEDQPTRVLLEDAESHDTNETGGSDPDGITRVAGGGESPPRKRTVVSKQGDSKESNVDAHAATVVSDAAGKKTLRPDDSVAAETESERQHTQSHFHTVTETAATSGLFQDAAQQLASGWKHWASITAMLALLVLGVGLFIYALQPPSADELYRAASGGDIGAANTFLRRFPDDDRFDQIRNQVMDNRLAATIKRLKTKAKLKVTPLDPFEEGFLHALEGREQNPMGSKQRLDDWLTVYDDPAGQQSDELADMIELAEFERQQLYHRAPKIIIDDGAQELLAQIRRIVQADSPPEARKKLISMINIHDHHAWAKPAVDEARKQLRLLEGVKAPIDVPAP